MHIRTKQKPAAPMHVKSYQIDGRLLRTGAARFTRAETLPIGANR
jgi:hypothetical protein